MNKEITYLKNNFVEVTDENGNVTKRIYEDKIEEILASENKLENIEQIISDLSNEINSCKEFDIKSNKLYKFLPILIVLHILVTFLLGSTIPVALGGSLVYGLISCGVMQVAKKHSNKIKKGLFAKLKVAEQLKDEYQNELNEVMLKSSITNYNGRTNEKASVKYSHGLDDYIINEMNITYNSEDKPLVRKRNK